MKNPPKIYIAELNLTVGDVAGNQRLIAEAYTKACEEKAELMVCSELCVVGYPPEDLVFVPALQKAALASVLELAKLTNGDDKPAMIIGSLSVDGDNIYNSIFLLDGGEIIHTQHKHHLPNYGVFDEMRVFARGDIPDVVQWRGVKLGLMICEDMWHSDVPDNLAKRGADLFICINASPFEIGKHNRRLQLANDIVNKYQIPLVYVNQIGGQDELVFDGGSFIMGAEFTEFLISNNHKYLGRSPHPSPLPQGEGSDGIAVTGEGIIIGNKKFCNNQLETTNYLLPTYTMMCLALKDYVHKNGFSSVVLGLSGGIDSALTAVVAVDALGKENVHAVMMPSPYTSEMSVDDAKELAKNLGIRLDEISIEQLYELAKQTLSPIAKDGETIPTQLADENLQSRLRGVYLMTISNSLGSLLLTTGNKSELAVGYATLYGDMSGAFSVLKDLYKTQVFELSRWVNERGAEEIIPKRIITRPPSAELREGQKDEDSLPPYAVLDVILREMIEEYKSVDEITQKHGFARQQVARIAKLLYINEYKRSQAPIGVKLSKLSFGRDRRFPLTNKFEL